MKFRYSFLVTLTFFFVLSCKIDEKIITDKGSADGALSYQMYNPSINNPDKEWSYYPKPTTVIGVPFSPKPVQLTYDGAIFTGQAELCFFSGNTLRPLFINQRHFYKGWIPIVEDDWTEDGINYSIELFGMQLDNEDSQNSIQYVKVSLNNKSKEKKTAKLAAGISSSGLDHRKGNSPNHAKSDFEFEANSLFRDGKLLYTFSEGAEKYAVPGIKYTKKYNGADFNLEKDSPTGITIFERKLDSGEKVDLFFKMPRVPINTLTDKAFVTKFFEADHAYYKTKTIDFWEKLLTQDCDIFIPEKRVNESYKAGLVHLILATRLNNGKKRQGSGLPYDGLFFNDFVDMRRIYDFNGLHEFVDINTQWLLDNQNESGMFLDPILTHGKEIMASHGQALVSLAHHYLMTENNEYLEKTYPTMKKAVEWMGQKHKENPNGLMPASTPFDAEMIKGHYTSHNLWCLLGLRDAIRVAKRAGKTEDIERWMKLNDSYTQSILTAIEKSAKEDGYIPPGLYEYIIGEEAREGFPEYRTNQDWENMLLVYPTEALKMDDPRVAGTLNRIRTNKYREGIMTYRDGMHLHQYATINLANQYLAINNQKNALLDLYHVLLHNGPTHEGFENMIEPWEDRDPEPCPPPHAWAAAKTSLLIRNCLIREYGGDAGINENERDLYLFSVLSPEWTTDGKEIRFINMPTEMGAVSATLTFSDNGAHLNLNNRFQHSPHRIAIPVPYFVELIDVEHNAKTYHLENDIMYFSPNVSEIHFTWKKNTKVFKNNFQNILLSYRKERGTRWESEKVDVNNSHSVTIMNKDKKAQMYQTPNGPGFLLKEEKNYPAEHLSFELIKKAFSAEYSRRFEDYLEAGKKELVLESPYSPLLNKTNE